MNRVGREVAIDDAGIRRRAGRLAWTLDDSRPFNPDAVMHLLALHLNAHGIRLPVIPPWLGRRTDLSMATKVMIGLTIELGPIEPQAFWERLHCDAFMASILTQPLFDGAKRGLVSCVGAIRATRGSV